MTREVPVIGGTLLSPRAAAERTAARDVVASSGTANARAATAAAVAAWAAASMRALGPASSARRLAEVLETLFSQDLGFVVRPSVEGSIASSPTATVVVLHAMPFAHAMTSAPRAWLRTCAACGASWSVAFNGVALALVDMRATAARRALVVTLDDLASRAPTAALIAAVFDARAIDNDLPDLIALSDRTGHDVRRALRDGVDHSIGALCRELRFDEGIGVLFRMLFVLFAEARTLVPMWHAIYREHYSLDALAAHTSDPRGVWAALEAARRLLGEGFRTGSLDVPAFNGRLFAPTGARRWARSPALDSALDRPAADALASLVRYRPARGGARRVDYAELDVEELGSIYERVLDLDPASEGRARKESGSFYTPRSLTTFLVRRTLAPLVEDASSDAILSLRIVDPAMGSGAFLVAALQYLSGGLERALVREGRLPEHDIDERDRAGLRRLVAQRCLYGVDTNPTAVMLARLSLWLATLSSGKPLTFLDHHLRCGNSLIGIDPERARRPPVPLLQLAPLPLFDADDYRRAIEGSAERAAMLTRMAEDSLAEVRAKERAFAEQSSPASALSPWRVLCDAWCAAWFLPAARRPDAREYRAVVDALVTRSRVLSKRGLGRRLREAAELRTAHQFFHWPLEFPDVVTGGARGFDAVIGNPPWEMLRAEGGSDTRHGLKAFARRAGVFALTGDGHVNLYQLFVERALQLARPGGRIGLIVPWGLMADEGSAALRAHLLDGTALDTFVRFDNARAIFQAHRSLRFAAIAATTAASTDALRMIRAADAATLDDLPDRGALPDAAVLTQTGLHALGGRTRRIPDAASAAELAIALKLATTHRALADPDGWSATFGRELNLTDDRAHFVARTRSTLPVLEGKHVHPHHVDVAAARHHITRAAAARLLPARPFDRPRLAYRDVTAQTNTQTLIAAIVPSGAVTGHSLFCLRGDDWSIEAQRALCAVLNSAVANFLIRLFVSAHVTTALMAWLPVPEQARVVAVLGDVRTHTPEIDRLVAGLYGLTDDERHLIAS